MFFFLGSCMSGRWPAYGKYPSWKEYMGAQIFIISPIWSIYKDVKSFDFLFPNGLTGGGYYMSSAKGPDTESLKLGIST
jgi:hypothetical protein